MTKEQTNEGFIQQSDNNTAIFGSQMGGLRVNRKIELDNLSKEGTLDI